MTKAEAIRATENGLISKEELLKRLYALLGKKYSEEKKKKEMNRESLVGV